MTEAIPDVLPAAAGGPAANESRNPFAVAGFRTWWLASVVAGTGVGIQSVTVPLFIKDRVAEEYWATAIAAVLICQTLPGAVLALFGGVIADRVERRRILVRTYFVAAAVSLVYVALAGSGATFIWPVFLLAAVVGSAGAFTNPARQSMMPQLLSQSQIQNGAIFGTMAFMATLQFGGPAVGGILADGPGLTFAFATEVAALALAAVLFWTIATDTPVPTGKSVLHDLAEGLRYVKRDSSLLGIFALVSVPGVLLMAPFMVTLVLVVDDLFKASDRYVGFLIGGMGLGTLTGSLLLSVIRIRRRGLLLCGSLFGGGIFWTAYGLAPNEHIALALIFIAGALGPAVFLNFAAALLQENTDRAMMGRVMSLYGLSFQVSSPLGYALAAAEVALWGPQPTLVISAATATGLGVVAMLFLRPVTRLR